MSENMPAVKAALQDKFAGESLDGTVKFDIEEEGVLRVVDGEVVEGDGEADTTIQGDLATMKEIFDGELSPTAAYMTGRIRIDGNMGLAMKLSSIIG